MEEMSRMRRQMTAIETIREFCRVWFEERDWKKTVEYLTEDVTFVGTGEHESARGKEAMEMCIRDRARTGRTAETDRPRQITGRRTGIPSPPLSPAATRRN